MKLLNQSFLLLFLVSNLGFIGCDSEDNMALGEYGIFSSQDESTVIMNGVIDADTPAHWENFIAAFPNTDNMVMKDCPGSDDDTANLELSRKIRNQGIAIHLPSEAVIASGAVDMYLAGNRRTREAGSRIGVHSWAEGSKEASSFPVGHENHLPYINYYKEMGFSQTQAEDFYYFTIYAAPAAAVHWMSEAEIEKYKLLSQ